MKRKPGRPKTIKPAVAMTFRLKSEFAELVKKISERENLSQARIIEIALSRHAKDIRLA